MALSRFGMTDPWLSNQRDPFDDFFTTAMGAPWMGGGQQVGGALATRGAAQQPLLPPMHMDVKGACAVCFRLLGVVGWWRDDRQEGGTHVTVHSLTR